MLIGSGKGGGDAAPLGFLFQICGVLFGQPELLFDSFSHNHFSFQVLGQSPNEAFVRPVEVQTHCSLIVRPLENGEYEVISGHRRLHVAEKVGVLERQ